MDTILTWKEKSFSKEEAEKLKKVKRELGERKEIEPLSEGEEKRLETVKNLLEGEQW